MDRLAILPVFLKLDGKRAVVAGGTDAAAWKAELLLAAGALVDVYAETPGEPMLALVEDGNLTLSRKHWSREALTGAAVAVGDCADDAEALAFAGAARKAGVPVNVIDKPEVCDFQFGSIVNRSPLVVGISTDGAAPVFSQALRSRIETILPLGFRRWAEAAKSWRPIVQGKRPGFRERRGFWERFARLALAAPARAPTDADRERLLDGITEAPAPGEDIGLVSLVGAGPGDPELLTLKAVRVLQSADVVLFDDLVPASIVEMARREAERITVGKRGHKPSCTQEEISGMLVELARAGKRVVRLKGGDPMIFGRAGEEIRALARAEIPFEVVPGVTAATGAAAMLGVSLTHRDHARRLQFVTAHARDGKLPADLDWRALVDPAATTVIYMGVKTLPELTARLIAEGIAPTTPAILVERATQLEERTVAATVADLAARVAEAKPTGPCLVMIGEALRERGDAVMVEPGTRVRTIGAESIGASQVLPTTSRDPQPRPQAVIPGSRSSTEDCISPSAE